MRDAGGFNKTYVPLKIKKTKRKSSHSLLFNTRRPSLPSNSASFFIQKTTHRKLRELVPITSTDV